MAGGSGSPDEVEETEGEALVWLSIPGREAVVGTIGSDDAAEHGGIKRRIVVFDMQIAIAKEAHKIAEFCCLRQEHRKKVLTLASFHLTAPIVSFVSIFYHMSRLFVRSKALYTTLYEAALA